MLLPYLILIIVCIFLYVALSDWFSREARLIRKIPGPKAWPIVGNSLSCMLPPEKLGMFFRILRRDYGHLNQIHAMKFRMVNITSPDDMEKILSATQNVSKADFYNFAAPWLGDGLLLSNGTKWHQRRKLLTKAFHFNILKKFMITFKEETEELLKQLEEETTKDRSNLVDLLRPFTLRTISETAMGISLREDKVAYTKYFNSILAVGDCMVQRFAKIWLHNDFVFNLSEIAARQRDALRRVHGFINKVIKDRREMLNTTNFNATDDDSVSYDKNEKMALLDLLLQNEKSGVINNEGIQDEVNTFMFEGYDTTTLALSFFIMAIANEPAIQDKIYEEQVRVLGDSHRSPTAEEMNEMKYLECCIKESLRLYPSAPFVSRKLLEDTVLSGYTVPAGSTCFLFIFDLHRRPDLFPDPDRFDPDRFLPENCQNRHLYSYIPFSAGLRNCIGQKFAMLEMKMLLSGLYRKFRVEPITRPSELIFRADMLLRVKNQMYVRFHSRK